MKLLNFSLKTYSNFNKTQNFIYLRNFCLKTNNEKDVRLRFAPSPTGFMHIGGVRTALINYLFAKKYNGSFILRIEDTDQKRRIDGATENIQDTLEWLGLKPDEGPFTEKNYGPYYQSQRLDLYKKFAYHLLETGHAYRCFCDETLLKLLRDQAKKNRNIIGYDNRCRHLTKDEIEKNLSQNKPYSLRFKLNEGNLIFNDLIKGDVNINLAETEPDFVILKSDKYPTYHLANVIDDYHMKISHVIRGLEWLNSTPKHIMLYKAFNWELPEFGHLPLIHNPNGSKLSKRNEDINVINLRKKGVFKESLLNYIITIGGGFKTDFTKNNSLIYSLEYLINDFDKNLLRFSSTKLDIQKIFFFNLIFMKKMLKENPKYLYEDLKKKILNDFPNADTEQLKYDNLIKLLSYTIQNKINSYDQLKKEYEFFWTEDYSTENKLKIKIDLDKIKDDYFKILNDFDDKITKENFQTIQNFCKTINIGYGSFMQLNRFLITGKINGPSISDLYELLGKKLFIKRLEKGFLKSKI